MAKTLETRVQELLAAHLWQLLLLQTELEQVRDTVTAKDAEIARLTAEQGQPTVLVPPV